MVGRLEALLEDPARRDAAFDAIRSMITEIRVGRAGPDGHVPLERKGDLAEVLAVCGAAAEHDEARLPAEDGLSLSVVAGAGFEPATFRL